MVLVRKIITPAGEKRGFGMIGSRTRILSLAFIVLCITLTQTEPVAAANASRLVPGPPGTPSGQPLELPAGSGVTTFSFNNRSAGLAPGTVAGDAFDLAVGYVAGWLQDPVDVVLELELVDLPGTRLAEADNNNYSESFNSVRAAMILDQQAHVGVGDITDDLPAFSQLNVQLPTVGTTWSLGGSMEMTRANAKALGLLGPSTSTDSTIRFDSGTTFDYDPTDGIDPGAFDFVGIAVHEIGHTLGFDSEVDKADLFWSTSGVALSLSPMDMFRLLPGQTDLSFKTATRILTTGDDPGFETQVSYQGLGIEAELSTAAGGGNTGGASHWADAMGLGIMDPTFAAGEAGVPTFTDWRVFDLIGWDAVQPMVLATPVPAAVWLFGSGLALLGFTGKRRRS